MRLFDHEPLGGETHPGSTGVLLANLGTPDAPDASSLRTFLREFLGDPRVIEEPRWKWWTILHLFILPFRPRQSAELYKKIWTPDGSPLLTHSSNLAAKVATLLSSGLEEPPTVTVGMRYGEPSIARGLRALRRAGCDRVVVLPLFPQYSGTTVASVFDAVAAELSRWRVVPELRTVHHYHDDAAYIDALAGSIRELWSAQGEPDKLLLSFHGIPKRYSAEGDPYQGECLETARLVREALGIEEERFVVSFQSIFGKEEWIGPATDATIAALARAGVRRLDVACPGFSVDCLETLEEIDQLNREIFLENGGKTFRYIPCLNDSESHARTILGILRRNLAGWAAPSERATETGAESWRRLAL